MFLLTVKKKYIRELTLTGIVLTALVTVIYHLFIPDRYFLWFPSIPIFFYLFGLFYIYMFAFNYRLGLDKIAATYLICKTVKFILSALVLIFYGFVVRHEVVPFFTTFIVFYFAFLIFETRFFLRFEEKLKLRKKANDENNAIHNDTSASVTGRSLRERESQQQR